MAVHSDPMVRAVVMRVKAAGWGSKQAAEAAGMSERSWQRLVAGEGDMRLGQLRTLIRELKVTYLDVFFDAALEETTTPWDVAAAARWLPGDARALLVQLLVMLYRDVESPP